VIAHIGAKRELDEAAIAEGGVQRGEELIGLGKRRVDGVWSSLV
jgi:hypothetical protein